MRGIISRISGISGFSSPSIFRRFRHSTAGKCAFLPSRPSHKVATDLPPLTPCKQGSPKKHRKSCRFFLCAFLAHLCASSLSSFPGIGCRSLFVGCAARQSGEYFVHSIPPVQSSGIALAVRIFRIFQKKPKKCGQLLRISKKCSTFAFENNA